MRTVGVEEELLLVDGETGVARALAPRVLRPFDEPDEDAEGGSLVAELQREQVETDTPPRIEMADLLTDLTSWRHTADRAARAAGARVAALAISPLPVRPTTAPKARYAQMVERFGMSASDLLICGQHVHVRIDSEDEAVAVLDRLRVWLPTLLALSANSPFADGRDTSYASYRSQSLTRWPLSGPTDVHGSAAAHEQMITDALATEVLLDAGMLYFDARASRRFPTVEVRVTDICQDVADAVLIAALIRGLVETAARDWAAGTPPPDVPTRMIRLANWQAARHGMAQNLLEPVTSRPRPAGEVVTALVEHVRPALTDSGDLDLVLEGVARIGSRGTGADLQRRTLERTGDLAEVVAAAARRTIGHE
ncbi:YbdK family carboxylate-amine ligase [Occultella glacieicola]|uniref:Putative glutamate--cysteine ligase 2 n=1 Tax=Occultella glacieicola TaxID=2518684 RepID=A0ABY2E2Q9_9MICO|nr:glutamate--cysteine ligase [Occultella glacieicola]TDE92756.1 YbdK family carboxylate-amine ligase [Occultella glacieicola]